MERVRVLQPDRCPISAPRPILWSCDETRGDRIVRHVTEDLPEVPVVAYVQGLEAVLPEMPRSGSPCSRVAPPRKAAVQLSHPFRESAFVEKHDEVNVIRDLAP